MTGNDKDIADVREMLRVLRDHPDTVHADIVSVLEKTLVRLEEAA